MTEATLERALTGDERAFEELVEPYRRELQLHCYRILGSLHDAEDAVQETLVSAWRGLDRFERKASIRTWLYRIATNRCLNMLRDGARRPRAAAGLPFDPPPPSRMSELTYLEPYPDAWLESVADTAPGPEARYETREAIGLAFITGLQRLAPTQRATLVLRDVLGFRAAEVAGMLETTEHGVNSALQRAHAALEDRLPPPRERAPMPDSTEERELAMSFADAFERADWDRLVALLTDEAWITMPPEPFEYQGREMIAAFLHHVSERRGEGGITRMLPTRANGQPAFGHYLARAGEETAIGTGLFVLTLEGDRIAMVSRFGSADLPPRFGLPAAVRL